MKNLAELLALALATVPSQADIASCHRWSRGRGMRRQRWLTIMLVLAWAGCSPVEGPGGQGPEVSDGAGHDGAADLPSDGQSELPTLSDTIQPGDLTEPSDAGAPGDPVPGDVSPDSLADVNGD
ncbi:MAG: hypothetical protein FJ098_16760, partial [Deltaproteobacteria bacterium]|nr:hypothetical protein [Deltaproteobacteria bacterium]